MWIVLLIIGEEDKLTTVVELCIKGEFLLVGLVSI